MRSSQRVTRNKKLTGASDAATGQLTTNESSSSGRTSLRASKRQRDQQQIASVTSINSLPVEVIEVIGSKLSVADLVPARLVCKLWAQSITKGATTINTSIHPDALSCTMALDHAQRLMPIASTIAVHWSTRTQQGAADTFFARLQKCRQLRHLTLQAYPCGDPKQPQHAKEFRSFKGLAALTQLTSLSIRDINPNTSNNFITPCGEDICNLKSLANLTKLVLTTWDRSASDDLTDKNSSGLNADQAAGLCTLTQLQHLEVRLNDIGAKEFGMNLHNLTRLTHLKVMGSPVDTFTSDYGDSQPKQCIFPTKLVNLKSYSMLAPSGGPVIHDEDRPFLTQLNNLELTIADDIDVMLTQWLRFILDNPISHSLTKLVVRSHVTEEHLPLFRALAATPLQHLEVYSISSTVHTSQFLTSLYDFRSLKTIAYRRQGTAVADKTADNDLAYNLQLIADNLPGSLERLELEGLMDADIQLDTLSCLKQCTRLRVLSIKCLEACKYTIPVTLGSLPPSLEVLKLRFAQLQQLEPGQHYLPALKELSLTACSAECMQQFTACLSNLKGLESLQLDNVAQLKDCHIASLSCLTGLTNLSVLAVPNQNVTNAALCALTSLTGLRKLAWHVGDMLDVMPDPMSLRSFHRLVLLSITTSMYFRLMRWNALSVMDYLPRCQLDTVGQ